MNILTADGVFELTESVLRALKRNYSQIDVEAEIDQMNLWLTVHASRRPKVYPLRFVERWLTRAKPKGQKLHIVGGKMSEADMLLTGAKLDMAPRPGESWESFGRRLREKSDRKQVANGNPVWDALHGHGPLFRELVNLKDDEERGI